jgi:DNA processing protein
MESLRFAHQFFHFHRAQWDRYWGGHEPSLKDVARLFQEDTFTRRALKRGTPHRWEEARREYALVEEAEERAGVKKIFLGQPAYPVAITAYAPPERRPPVLYLRGKDIPAENQLVAIVGTRFPSPAGADAAACFSAYFTTLGIGIVSGLAKGIDAIAHQENLRAGTVAVLGSGVLEVYPKENEVLAESLLSQGGALLSPFPLGQVPLPVNFPQRNDLIAALSVGTVVVEGAETSGAAVTGKQALSMGKSVVVLAQDFRTGFGRGAIRLQQAGANLVCSEEEALHSLFSRLGGFSGVSLPSLRGKSRDFNFEQFLRAAGKDVPAALVLLEEGISTGKIERRGADLYRLRRGPNPL